MNRGRLVLTVVTACGALNLSLSASGYHLLQKVVVSPGVGIWDYVSVDRTNRRVYCSHGDETIVLDADSRAVVGRMAAPLGNPTNGLGEGGRPTPFMGVHHVAIAEDLNRGFTANGRAGSTTIFDLKTLETIAEVPVTGRDPNAVVYDRPTGRLFVFNEASNNLTVIDARSGTTLKTLALPSRPAFAVSDGNGRVFVNLIEDQAVLPIDARSLTTGQPWPVAVCAGPYNETMAIDRKNGRLFVGCRPDNRQMLAPPGPRPNRVMAVIDTASGRVVATVPIGGNPDQADFDPEAGLVFSANGEGTVTVIKQHSPDEYSVLETVDTEPGAARLAVDPVTHTIFVPNADFGTAPGPPRNFRILVLGL